MLALISAPSNLGLRPPEPGTVPGTAKAPEALREAGLYARFAHVGAADAGVILPARYVDKVISGRVRNSGAVLDHARRLAARIGERLDYGETPLVLGGDCSLLIAAGQALHGRRGRYGLVHLDGHTDFRHPGNSDRCASLAGEDLAAAVGLHWPAISGPEPCFRPEDVVHIGCRDDDEHLAEAASILAQVIPARRAREDGMRETARRALETVGRLDGYWLHLDVDILDPADMPAVDSPDPGGLQSGGADGVARRVRAACQWRAGDGLRSGSRP
jgi:arginase